MLPVEKNWLKLVISNTVDIQYQGLIVAIYFRLESFEKIHTPPPQTPRKILQIIRGLLPTFSYKNTTTFGVSCTKIDITKQWVIKGMYVQYSWN